MIDVHLGPGQMGAFLIVFARGPGGAPGTGVDTPNFPLKRPV